MLFLFLQIGLWILLAGLWGLLVGWWIWGRGRDESRDAIKARRLKRQLEQSEARCTAYENAALASRKAMEQVSVDVTPEESPDSFTNSPVTDRNSVFQQREQVVEGVYDRQTVAANASTSAVNMSKEVDVIRDEWRPPVLETPDGIADDLKHIKGIGPVIEKTLNSIGIFHFRQIAALTEDNIRWVDHYIAFPGRIKRENWLSQATKMAEGGSTEFSERYQRKKR